jgi:putative ABC transport system permease protein
MDTFWQDMRYGVRTLLKSPAFAIVAVITLALGIGANTAIFSVVNTLLLRPMPVKHPEQIYVLAAEQSNLNVPQVMFSIPEFHDIRGQASGVFSDTTAFGFGLDGMRTEGKTERFLTAYVSGNFFTAMGIKPVLGRLILPSEGETTMADPVMVLDYKFWKTRFGGDTTVIGRKISLNGRPITVVGVVAQDFTGINPLFSVHAYMPLGMMMLEGYPSDVMTNRQNRQTLLFTRLRDGTSVQQAQASLDVISKRLSQEYPKEEKDLKIQAYPELRARPQPDPKNLTMIVSGLFLGLTCLVLLLACANVANILLVRASVRNREMAVRAALGAARIRLVRQLLTESILLALAGGVAGLALGWVGSSALSRVSFNTDIASEFTFTFDWRVFAFSFGAALLTGFVVGIVPAVRASRGNLAAILHEGGRTVVGGRQRFRNVMVAVQVGASLMLLIIAGLFTRSLAVTQQMRDLGFEPNRLMNFYMDPNQIGYSEQQGRDFYKNLLERVRALPGVESASISSAAPMSYFNDQDMLTIDGFEAPPGQPAPTVIYIVISTDYFKTLKIPMMRGRVFTNADDEKAQYVGIVNESFAKKYWPNLDPIGRHFKIGSDPNHSIEVVGVAKNSRFQGMTGDINPFFYLPFIQHYAFNSLEALQVRTLGPPRTIIPEIGRVVEDLAPELSLFDVKTQVEAMNTLNGLMFYKLGAVLSALFGILGLTLAVVGVYGVISYAASQRTHEIGIRMALGAQPGDILKIVFGQGIWIVGIGVVLGIAAALAAAKVTSSFLTVSPMDPVAYLGASAALAVVALLACYIPSRRAMRVDPMVALRYE